ITIITRTAAAGTAPPREGAARSAAHRAAAGCLPGRTAVAAGARPAARITERGRADPLEVELQPQLDPASKPSLPLDLQPRQRRRVVAAVVLELRRPVVHDPE